jgi:hypothetical protein
MSTITEAVTVVEDRDLEHLDIARAARGECVRYSFEVTSVVRVPKSQVGATRIERLSPQEYRAYKEASDRAMAEYQSKTLATEKSD